MVDGVPADSIGWFMRKLEEDGRLRQASDAVVTYLRGHRIARRWGEGLLASSDMMSLEATRPFGTRVSTHGAALMLSAAIRTYWTNGRSYTTSQSC
jgi:Tn3 transposase DDE domain